MDEKTKEMRVHLLMQDEIDEMSLLIGQPPSTQDKNPEPLLETVRKAAESLSRIMRYEKGWDGYYGDTFSIETITSAYSVLALLNREFLRQQSVPDELSVANIEVGPRSDGCLDIQVVHGQKEATITVVENGTITLCYKLDEMAVSLHEELSGYVSLLAKP